MNLMKLFYVRIGDVLLTETADVKCLTCNISNSESVSKPFD